MLSFLLPLVLALKVEPPSELTMTSKPFAIAAIVCPSADMLQSWGRKYDPGEVNSVQVEPESWLTARPLEADDFPQIRILDPSGDMVTLVGSIDRLVRLSAFAQVTPTSELSQASTSPSATTLVPSADIPKVISNSPTFWATMLGGVMVTGLLLQRESASSMR